MRIRETTLECREMFDRLTRDKEVVEGLAEKLNIFSVQLKSIPKWEKKIHANKFLHIKKFTIIKWQFEKEILNIFIERSFIIKIHVILRSWNQIIRKFIATIYETPDLL